MRVRTRRRAEAARRFGNDNHYLEYSEMLAREQPDVGRCARAVRINFENVFRLAQAGRTLGRAVAAGSIPPEMRQLWNRMEAAGVEVQLFDRGSAERGEQDTPDRIRQLRMLEDALDHNGNPGVVVLLTGDGAGFYEGTGFHSTLERMHKRGWRVEILSWRHSCNQRMRRWAEENGLFIALDDYYDSITFLTPSRPGFEHALARQSVTLDLSLRKES